MVAITAMWGQCVFEDPPSTAFTPVAIALGDPNSSADSTCVWPGAYARESHGQVPGTGEEPAYQCVYWCMSLGHSLGQRQDRIRMLIHQEGRAGWAAEVGQARKALHRNAR